MSCKKRYTLTNTGHFVPVYVYLCTKGNCAEMSVIFTAVVVVIVVGILITYEISHKLTQNVKLAVQAQMSKGLTAQLGMGGASKKTVV